MRICYSLCELRWSDNGRFLYISLPGNRSAGISGFTTLLFRFALGAASLTYQRKVFDPRPIFKPLEELRRSTTCFIPDVTIRTTLLSATLFRIELSEGTRPIRAVSQRLADDGNSEVIGECSSASD
jgi:hypothetical protein